MKKEKLVISLDIDGVLADYPKCWLDYINEKIYIRYNTVEEAKKNLAENYFELKDLYRKSGFKRYLPVRKELFTLAKYLKKNNPEIDFIISTSRPIYDNRYPQLLDDTQYWLKSNGLDFIGLYDKNKIIKFQKKLGIKIIGHIEDEIKYAQIFLASGIPVIAVKDMNIPSNNILVITEKYLENYNKIEEFLIKEKLKLI